MRILEVISQLGSGGAERLCVDLSNALCRNDAVGLLVIKDIRRNGRDFYLKELNPCVQLIELGLGDGFHFSYEFKVRNAIRSFNPDIVHIHVEEKYCLAALLAYRKPKYFVTIHSSPNLYTVWYDKVLYGVLAPVGLFTPVTISDVNRKMFSEVYPKCRFERVYNGRSSLFKTEKYESVRSVVDGFKRTENTRVFVTLSRFAPAKNHSMMVSSFNRLLSEGLDATLMIVGSGFDSDAADELKKKSDDRIHFIGEVNNVSDYLFCSDIFCLSSLYEGMPISVIEAQLAGLPVVSTPVCGVVDAVQSGVTGVISEDFSEDCYCKAITMAYEQCAVLKHNVLSMLSDYPFGIDYCAKAYHELFEQKHEQRC